MSWNDFISTQLVASGQVCQAAILSNEDGSVWACTPDFCPRGYEATITTENGDEQQMINEAANLVQLISGTRPAQGLRVNGQKYMILRTQPEPYICYGKKPRGGITIAKTNKSIILATFDENLDQNAGGCNMAVENLAEYLREQGF